MLSDYELLVSRTGKSTSGRRAATQLKRMWYGAREGKTESGTEEKLLMKMEIFN